MENRENVDEVVVVMVPFYGQGHLNQFLHLACLISSYGLPIYYVSLPTYNNLIKLRANALNPSELSKIHFHDLPAPDLTAPPTTIPSASKIPDHYLSQPLWNSCVLLREPIASFLADISSKARRVVVIHDPFTAYNVQDFASLPNAESYLLGGNSCFETYCSHICPALGLPIPLEADLLKRLPSTEGTFNDDIFKHLAPFQYQYMGKRSGDIHNTSPLIEGGSAFIDSMAQLVNAQNIKQWAIGPILPTKIDHHSTKENECLDWLNKQPPRSVLFVSFGTSTEFSDEQINELAMGLELSKQKFIWVLRDADKGYVLPGKSRRLELPEGFEERVKGVQGLVVRGWAPQPEILAHPSTGGFMSHCGWNSCIESITIGMPMAAWPMHSDQPKNGFLVTDILKTGLIVREWAKHKELVTASTIENVVRKLMASEEGDEVNKRAQKLGESVRQSREKGGVSRIQLDSFIAHITR